MVIHFNICRGRRPRRPNVCAAEGYAVRDVVGAGPYEFWMEIMIEFYGGSKRPPYDALLTIQLSAP